MNTYWKITLFEYRMSIRRWGLWLPFGLLCLFYVFADFRVRPEELPPHFDMAGWWRYAARMAMMFNLFMPVVAGILASDRLWRDDRLHLTELLTSTPLRRWPYILGKYTGTLLSLLTPALLLSLAVTAVVLGYGAPGVLIPMIWVTFLVIVVPAYAFITIFSLACPLVIPLRVYQVLFTGYWFWGNFLSPRAVPTWSETLLNASGKYAMDGFFGEALSIDGPTHTSLEAVLNLAVLTLCIVAAMLALEWFLALRARRA